MEPQWYQFVHVLVIFIVVSTVKLQFISYLLSILWGDTLRLCSSLDFCSVVLPLLIIIEWINYHGCKMAFNNSVILSLSLIYIFSISIGSWFLFYSMVCDSTVPDSASGRPSSWLLCPLNIFPTFLKHLLLSCTKKIFQALLILTQPSPGIGHFSKDVWILLVKHFSPIKIVWISLHISKYTDLGIVFYNIVVLNLFNMPSLVVSNLFS